MGYSIDWSDLEQRIQDQKAALLDTSQNMDPERLKFLVETYDECKGESVFITRAKLFEKVSDYQTCFHFPSSFTYIFLL